MVHDWHVLSPLTQTAEIESPTVIFCVMRSFSTDLLSAIVEEEKTAIGKANVMIKRTVRMVISLITQTQIKNSRSPKNHREQRL